jgi:hypothetical protein
MPGFKTGGRKKGSKNKRQTALKEAAEIVARAALADLTPLEFMLEIMRNPDQSRYSTPICLSERHATRHWRRDVNSSVI